MLGQCCESVSSVSLSLIFILYFVWRFLIVFIVLGQFNSMRRSAQPDCNCKQCFNVPLDHWVACLAPISAPGQPNRSVSTSGYTCIDRSLLAATRTVSTALLRISCWPHHQDNQYFDRPGTRYLFRLPSLRCRVQDVFYVQEKQESQMAQLLYNVKS